MWASHWLEYPFKQQHLMALIQTSLIKNGMTNVGYVWQYSCTHHLQPFKKLFPHPAYSCVAPVTRVGVFVKSQGQLK